QTGQPQARRLLGQLLGMAGAVEEGEVGVAVQLRIPHGDRDRTERTFGTQPGAQPAPLVNVVPSVDETGRRAESEANPGPHVTAPARGRRAGTGATDDHPALPRTIDPCCCRASTTWPCSPRT